MHTTSTDPPSQTYMMNSLVVFCYGVKFEFSAEAGVESTALFYYFPSAFLTVREKVLLYISHFSLCRNSFTYFAIRGDARLKYMEWYQITILLFKSFQRITDVLFSSPFSVFGDSQWVERLDRLRAAWGKLQPFRIYIVISYNGGVKGNTNTCCVSPLSFFPLSFQSFHKDASSRPTAVSGIKRYLMERRRPLHSHYHSDWSSGFCPKS